VALQKSLATLADRLFSAVHSTELKLLKKPSQSKMISAKI
jgi:hypothetical protein